MKWIRSFNEKLTISSDIIYNIEKKNIEYLYDLFCDLQDEGYELHISVYLNINNLLDNLNLPNKILFSVHNPNNVEFITTRLDFSGLSKNENIKESIEYSIYILPPWKIKKENRMDTKGDIKKYTNLIESMFNIKYIQNKDITRPGLISIDQWKLVKYMTTHACVMRCQLELK